MIRLNPTISLHLYTELIFFLMSSQGVISGLFIIDLHVIQLQHFHKAAYVTMFFSKTTIPIPSKSIGMARSILLFLLRQRNTEDIWV